MSWTVGACDLCESEDVEVAPCDVCGVPLCRDCWANEEGGEVGLCLPCLTELRDCLADREASLEADRRKEES